MILFCGLTTIDVVHNVSELPGRGLKAVAGGTNVDVGGPATNASRTAAALGHSARLASLLGTGPLATLAKHLLTTEGIETIDLAEDGDPAISSIALTPDGERTVISSNNTARTAKSHDAIELPDGILDGVAVVLVDGHLMATQTVLARRAQSLGIPVVLDAGSYRKGIEELMSACSHVVASSTFRFPDSPDISGPALCKRIADLGPKLAGQTHGPQGIDIYFNSSHHVIPVDEPTGGEVVDTLGAGDVMHGALAAAMADGREGLGAVVYASSIATASVAHPGVLGWVRARR